MDRERRTSSQSPRCGSAAPSRRATRARASPRSEMRGSSAPRGRCSGRSCRRRRRPCKSRTRSRRSPPRSRPRRCREPPRPSVVMLPCSSTPWKPATTAIWPFFTVEKIFEPSMVLMRALVNAPSVRILTWWPSSSAPGRPRLDGHRGERRGRPARRSRRWRRSRARRGPSPSRARARGGGSSRRSSR